MRSLAVVAATLLLLAVGASAEKGTAKTRAEAHEHLTEGNKAFRLGELQRALEEYRRSYELDPQPIALFNIGQTYRKLGDNEKARHAYLQFLDTSPSKEDEQTTRRLIEEVQAAIDQQSKAQSLPPSGPASPDRAPSAHTAEKDPAFLPDKSAPPEDAPKSRTWLWVTLAAVAAVVVVGAVVIGIAATPHTPSPPMSTLGDYGVFR
jgi:tetratricopeptide (TPR) repeat protein